MKCKTERKNRQRGKSELRRRGQKLSKSESAKTKRKNGQGGKRELKAKGKRAEKREGPDRGEKQECEAGSLRSVTELGPQGPGLVGGLGTGKARRQAS